jgi:hypothetical protein
MNGGRRDPSCLVYSSLKVKLRETQWSWSGVLVSIVLLVTLATILVSLVPLLECPTCLGNGGFYVSGLGQRRRADPCPRCGTGKKVTLLNKWFFKAPDPYRN